MTTLLVALAGLLGASGVGLAAAAAHVTGGEAVRAAAEIAMVHAAAVVALVAFAGQTVRPALWRAVAAIMLLGAVMFTAAVASGSLLNFKPIPALAPIGGSLTIASWLAVTIAALWSARGAR
ncbi:MAG: DUF423 domain-containing protein [Hyphomicrobiaceae bacterium]|nr:DUF423 domain-containing protein [Hyphomicrobiaceae bacterium]